MRIPYVRCQGTRPPWGWTLFFRLRHELIRVFSASSRLGGENFCLIEANPHRAEPEANRERTENRKPETGNRERKTAQ